MADGRVVFFFDIDNCLYPKSMQVQKMMSDLIDKYFMTHLSLSQDEANDLHLKYYKEYGLAIEGLVRHHKVEPLEYNKMVDDALPLEGVLTPNRRLRNLLLSINRTKVKLWLFTNAYVNHGLRVVKLLGVDDLFEGITYCDYGAERFVCKPHDDMFKQAMTDAGVDDFQKCYFVATRLGWRTVHLVEAGETQPVVKSANHQIEALTELKSVFPNLFAKP